MCQNTGSLGTQDLADYSAQLTQQVMKHQAVIEIFLQTLNHYVLGFQSAIDPFHQRLQKKRLIMK